MPKTVLLGMDEATASKFGPYLESNSSVLKVMTQSIPIFHNLKQALYQYSPQIVYLSLSRMRYDHIKAKDIEDEILDGIYEIKSDPQLSNIRIAVQTNERTNPIFLRKLAMLRVSDIFLSQGKSGQMDKVAPQLSHAPNIKNISEFLSGDAPSLKVVANNSDGSESGIDQNRVDQLEHLLGLANAQIAVLKKKNDLTAVPRSDYDELLQQVKMLMNSKLTDAKSKQLFAEVLNSKVADGKKISRLSKIVDVQNNQILNLNTQVSQMEKRNSQINDEEKQPDRIIEAPPERQRISDNQERRIKELSKPRNSTKDRGHPKVRKRETTFDFGKFVRVTMSILLILLLLCAGGIFWTHLDSKSANSSSQSESPSFNSLIKKGKYVKAAKLYTDRGVEAENAMLSDPNIKNKGDIANGIAEYNDSDAIKFDTSYFAQDFSSASSIFNESTDTNLTHLIKARRIMVAYALMKSGQIAKAKSIAESLHNDQLNERIKVYGQFYHANQILEAKIKHGHLNSEEITKAKKQISSNQTAMDKL